jgi:hypothetical protein
MSRRLEDSFQACLEALEHGGDLESVLAAYPDLRDDLEPLLAVAVDAIDAGETPVPAEAARRSRARALSLAAALRSARPAARTSWPTLARGLTAALTALALVLVSGAGLLLVSAQSLPGERLYPIKRAAEAARLRFAISERDRVSLSVSYDHRRLDEARQLLARGRRSEVEYEGILTGQSGALWSVQGIPALATSATHIEPGRQIGDFVAVQGHTTDQGWVRADSIVAAGYLVQGPVESIGKDAWRVAGEDLTVVAATEIDPGIQMGDTVSATVRSGGDQPVAVRITLVSPAITNTPVPTPDRNATPAPSSTPTEDHGEEEEDGEAHGPAATASPTPEAGSTEEDDGDGHEDEHEGSEQAATPEGQEREFAGVVEAINGSVWTIAGRSVTVDADTCYEGDPQVGDEVKVRAALLADRTLLAEKIEVDD